MLSFVILTILGDAKNVSYNRNWTILKRCSELDYLEKPLHVYNRYAPILSKLWQAKFQLDLC